MATPAPSGDRIDAHFRKKRELDKEGPPGKLWTFALESVLEQIAEEAPEQFVQMVNGNARLRNLMVQEVVRKPHAAPQLGDTDIIEIFKVSVNMQHHEPAIFPVLHDEWTMTVGELPWRIREAIKYQYNMYATAVEQGEMPRHDRLRPTCDGRICFKVDDYKSQVKTCLTWLTSTYIDLLKSLVVEKDVPAWEDVQNAKWDDIDLIDRFPFLTKETMLYDAYDMQLNLAQYKIQLMVKREFLSVFCNDDSDWMESSTKIPIRAAWVRKPKLRVWVNMMSVWRDW